MSVLRRALPLLATTFVNKVGSIGLSLLPMLLVERNAGTAESSLVLGSVKAAGLVSVLVGGALSDRLGARAVVLLSFALQGIGLGLLPFAPTLALMALAGIVGRTGEMFFQSPARLLLTESAAREHRSEALGWLRTANNAGQVVCYGVGLLFAGAGVAPLMVFDAATSLVALGLGTRLLKPSETAEASAVAEEPPVTTSWAPALWCAAANAGFVLVYEVFMVGAAASYRDRFGDRGLAVFSGAMVVNTVLCALVAVVASRTIRSPRRALPAGAVLMAVGATVALTPTTPPALILVGAFVLTLGEVVFAALSQVTLLQLVPARTNRGRAYGSLLLPQMGGRIVGAAIAFPLVVHGSAPTASVAALGAISVVVAWYAGREAERVLRSASEQPMATAA